MNAQAVNHATEPTKRCSTCKQHLPETAFPPSVWAGNARAMQCRACQKARHDAKQTERYRAFAEDIRNWFGFAPWSAQQAAAVFPDRGTQLGMGAMIAAMEKRGLVRIHSNDGNRNLYVVAGSPQPMQIMRVPPEEQQVNRPRVADVDPKPPEPVIARTIVEHEPVYLEVGAYVFPGTVLIERDDRGGAVVTLPVAETDPRTGKAMPQEIQLTAEEWATRRRVTLSDVIDGSSQVALFDRVAELERTIEVLRRDLATAISERDWFEQAALKNEADANTYRRMKAAEAT